MAKETAKRDNENLKKLANYKKIESMDKVVKGINSELVVGTQGVTRTDRKNTSSDELRRVTNSLFIRGSKSLDEARGITTVTGKDKQSGIEVSKLMEYVMGNENIKVLREDPTIYSSEQITILMENDWMLSNMQQLEVAFEQIVVSILSPDDFSKQSIRLNVNGGTDEKLTKSAHDILIKELKLNNIIETALKESVKNGYQYIYHVPNSKLATDIYNTYSNRKKGDIIREDGSLNVHEDDKLNGQEAFSISIDKFFESTKSKLTPIKESNGNGIIDTCDKVNIFHTYITPKALDHAEMIVNESFVNDEIRESDAWSNDVFSGFVKSSNQHSKSSNRSRRLSELKIDEETISMKEIEAKFKKLTGVYVEQLDSKTITEAKVGNTMLGVFEVKVKTTTTEKGGIGVKSYSNTSEVAVLNQISKVLEGNIDPRFLRNNKHLLPNIKDILDRSTGSLDKVEVRYIPAKYLTKFTENCDSNGNPRSILQKARTPIYSWILLNKNHLMNDLFYKRDILLATAAVDPDDDDLNESVLNAIDELRDILPSPGELLEDTSKVYSRMGNGRVLMTFKEPDSEDPLTISKIEGQDSSNDSDLLKSYEDNAFDIINSGVNMRRDAESNFAATVTSKDGLAYRQAIARQANYMPQFSDLASKLYNMYDGDPNKDNDDVYVEVILNPPTNFINSLRNDKMNSIKEKIQNIVDIVSQAEDDDTVDIIKNQLTKELFKEETADMLEWDKIEGKIEKIKSGITNVAPDDGDDA